MQSMTLEEMKVYRYGETSVSKGTAYNPDKCGYEVWPPIHKECIPYQCKNSRKGDSLYCGKHIYMLKREL